MALQIVNSVGATVAAVYHNHPLNTGVVNELGAHHAGLTRHNQPGPRSSHPLRRGVADHVRFGVMAANLHPLTRRDAHGVAQTGVAPAELTTATRAAVVAIHQHHIAQRIQQHGTKLAPRTVRSPGQQQALFQSDLQVLGLHVRSQTSLPKDAARDRQRQGVAVWRALCDPLVLMPVLSAQHLSKSFGVSHILTDAQLHLLRGEKIGLVGRNGSGKSTLLTILAGVEPPDSGEVVLRSGTHVAYLSQNPALDEDATLLDVALAGAARCREVLDEHERLTRAEQALAGLGLRDPQLRVRLASGGTRRRAALAAALLQKPDLLLLDEPTNHLDTETCEWLQRRIQQFPGALILVTHDRWFLNQVVDRIVELRQGVLRSYPGTFQDYLDARMDEDLLADKLEARRQNLLRTELDWLSRSPAARSTKPKARIQRAETLQKQERMVQASIQLPQLSAERLGKTVLEARDLAVGFGTKRLVEHLDLLLQPGDRLGLVGPNGAGKTTLLRTLLGELAPLGGQIITGKNTQVMSIDQQRTGLDPRWTVQQAGSLAGGDWVEVGGHKTHVASWLEQFLFKTEDMRQQVSTLSGGQRFRLLLARKLQEPANVLVLDEPTNDLDFETLSVLEVALSQYPGCVLTVSHDRAFLDRVCTGILHVVGDGTTARHAGNYAQFLTNQAEQAKRDRAQERATQPAAAPKSASAKGAPAPKLTWAEEKKLAGIEAEIEAAEEAVAAAEARLEEPAVLRDATALGAATAGLAATVAARDALYEEWQRLDAKLAAWQASRNS